MAQNKHILIGRLGEDLAVGYLTNRGFDVVERNYRKKWGEIDVIAKKDGVLHFVEVKSGAITGPFPEEGRETFRPEDHVHRNKQQRLARTIETYLSEHHNTAETDWTVSVLVVQVNPDTQRARIRTIENVLLD